jgi:hypothetical protein
MKTWIWIIITCIAWSLAGAYSGYSVAFDKQQTKITAVQHELELERGQALDRKQCIRKAVEKIEACEQ